MRDEAAEGPVPADGLEIVDPTDTKTSELRRLTVLFCDLVGSTALSERLDPEDLREVVREYQAVSSEVIESWEGHIAQYLGDGLLVYFGYPQAHKDDPLRAVHSALGIVEAVEALNERLEREHGVRLAVRLGVHNGPVVVGRVGGGSTEVRLALGETPNVAAGLEGAVQPNGVALSAATLRFVRDVYPCEALGRRSLKGVADPVEVYRVEATAPAARPATRLERREGDEADAERRQLTVMFCDLVGSQELSAKLPPKRFRKLVLTYQKAASEVIERYGGHVAQYLGDGLMVYFGFPVADEDDTRNAVHTGLEILAAMAELNERLKREQGIRLEVRMGIHTGRVVAGEVGAGATKERLAVGRTPNVAARVQGMAEPGTVVLSASTYEHVEGVFDVEPLGARDFKGVSEPMEIYRALRSAAADDRFEAAVKARGLVPLVGRESELDLLRERFEQAASGLGQLVLLSGEAGIGKSRLRHQFKQGLRARPHVWLTGQCSAYHSNSAFYPLIQRLEIFFGLRRGDSPQRKLERLEAALVSHGFAVDETLPLFADLLSIPLDERWEPLGLAPQMQKQKTLEAMLALVSRLADEQPVVLALEDLHWVDPSTLEFLDLLVDRAREASILALLTFRPSFEPPWGASPHLSRIRLGRLTPEQVEPIVLAVSGGAALPPEVLREVLEKTDGVPIFVEELTKMVLESGQLERVNGHYELKGPLSSLAIPSTLQDSLTARLDRLPSGKEVAQLGAVIGREFSYELVEIVSAMDEAELQEALERLVEAEMLFQQGAPPASRYVFNHALIQDAAYRLLLKSTRKRYHERIARTLDAKFPETARTQPALLGHHYTEAGLNEQAVDYWLKAGRRSVGRSANIEAAGHLKKGLALLTTLPATQERDSLEFDFQTILGPVFVVSRGFGAPEVEQAYARAYELSERMGASAQLGWILMGLWQFYVTRAEFERSRELASQMMRVARSRDETTLLMSAHFCLGCDLYFVGEIEGGRETFEKGLALDSPDRERTPTPPGIDDPGLQILTNLAFLLWILGYPDQAAQRSEEAVALARQLSPSRRSSGLAWALSWRLLVDHCRGDGPAVREKAQEAIATCEEVGVPIWLTQSQVLLGSVQARPGGRHGGEGAAEEGMGLMRQAIDAFCATGATIWQTYFVSCLAEACSHHGQNEESVRLLDGALALVEKTGERWWAPEIHRLAGEAALRGSGGIAARRDAEGRFQEALAIARRSGAKSLELRAALSLSRLWREDQRQKARELLSGIYGWFTEGLDTRELRTARALLDSLS